MSTVFQDIRYGSRVLLKRPGFTLIAVITLALGIGANSAIFSVVNAVLIRPLPYDDPDRIVTALHSGLYPVAPANFLDWRTQMQSWSSIGAAQAWGATLTGSDKPEQLRGLQVTADLFKVLGVSPILGRTFLPDEDQPGADRVAVLSHHFWQRRFGSDPQLVGQTITLNGQAHTVVGVMPSGFQFAPFWITNAELWVPLNLVPRVNDRTGRSLRVFARLGPGVTREEAQAEMDLISRRLEEQHPGTNKRLDVTIDLVHEKVVGNVRRALLVLLAAVSFVLLIACANVANLLLARSAARRKEFALRAAIGAGRFRLVRQLLTEGLLLALVGGGLGIFLAHLGVTLLVALGPSNLPRLETISIDGWVLGFTLGTSLLTGLVFGLAPAFQVSRLDLIGTLKESRRTATDSVTRSRLRSALVVGEVALALMLLIGAGLLIRSFGRLQAIDAGFDPRNVLTFVVPLAGSEYSSGEQRMTYFDQLLRRVGALPGVESASAINHLPLAGDIWTLGFTVEGRPTPSPGEGPNAVYRIIRPDYFRTMGISLLRGRDFTERDSAAAPNVIIINEALGRSMWPDEDPIGKRIRVRAGNSQPSEIVGVVRNVKQRDWTAEPFREMYLPYLQNPDPNYLTLVIRTENDPLGLAAVVPAEVHAIDRNVPVSQLMTMEEALASAVAQPRFNLLVLNVFSAIALALAVVGVYGVMAYSVVQRTHEIGVRLSLGAKNRDVLKLVMGQGMLLTVCGLTIGLAGSLALTRLMAGMLFDTSPTDPTTFVTITAILTASALLACYVPARRATKVDPMVALRFE